MTKLNPGDIAPAFTLTNDDGVSVSLADYAGQQVVVYFYPRAMTPGCTKQACDFTTAKALFADHGYAIIGISPDKPEKLAKFREKEQLEITLLADPDLNVMKAYGAYGEKKLYGKVVEGVIRSTFIIEVDSAGIGHIKVAQGNVKATGHVAKLSRELFG